MLLYGRMGYALQSGTKKELWNAGKRGRHLQKWQWEGGGGKVLREGFLEGKAVSETNLEGWSGTRK